MIATRQQQMAQRAFDAVTERCDNGKTLSKKYSSFAKSFPSLIHSAGLCQAVAFALSKGDEFMVVEDLCKVLKLSTASDCGTLATESRTCGTLDYLRLTRLAMQAAGWIKRYAETLDTTEVDAADKEATT